MSENPPVTPVKATQSQSLSEFVGSRIATLQEQYIADASKAVAALAKLRRSIHKEPGADPAVWEYTLADFDQLPGWAQARGDSPSRAERAVHATMTLFATHQQSQIGRMHRPGVSVGAAARRLGLATNQEEAVRRRFLALGTAASFEETLHYARGLIGQLRANKIPLDYAQLADDLLRLQDPARADSVRLAWGRAYHRTAVDKPTDTIEPTIGD